MRIFLILLFISTSVFGQQIDYSPHFSNPNTKIDIKKSLVSSTLLAASVTSIYYAGKPIYYNQKQVGFFFKRNKHNQLEFYDNDVRGLDKFGHIYSTSLFAQNIYFMGEWSGLKNSHAAWTSFILASSIMGAMEVHDAYYQRWGFSIGDFLANLVGAGFYVGQRNIPFMRNLDYKLSYDFTREMVDEAVIESYPNMTFWLTANPRGFYNDKSFRWFPNWLNIAAGISVTHGAERKTEIIIALDYNLKRIRSKNRYLNHLIHLLDRYKLPAPGIRLAPGFVGYGLYF